MIGAYLEGVENHKEISHKWRITDNTDILLEKDIVVLSNIPIDESVSKDMLSQSYNKSSEVKEAFNTIQKDLFDKTLAKSPKAPDGFTYIMPEDTTYYNKPDDIGRVYKIPIYIGGESDKGRENLLKGAKAYEEIWIPYSITDDPIVSDNLVFNRQESYYNKNQFGSSNYKLAKYDPTVALKRAKGRKRYAKRKIKIEPFPSYHMHSIANDIVYVIQKDLQSQIKSIKYLSVSTPTTSRHKTDDNIILFSRFMTSYTFIKKNKKLLSQFRNESSSNLVSSIELALNEAKEFKGSFTKGDKIFLDIINKELPLIKKALTLKEKDEEKTN